MWFYFLPLDYRGVERRLNRYAETGWELDAERDGMAFSVPMQETKRTDLRYCVCCDSLSHPEHLPEIVAEKQAQGWQPIATINHFDIYASMPCQSPQLHEYRSITRLVLYALRSLFLFAFFATFLVGVTALNQIPLQKEWYLSNTGILLRGGIPVVTVGILCYLVWVIRTGICQKATSTYSALMGLHTTLAVGGMAFILLLTGAVVSDLVFRPWAQILLLLFFLGGLLFCYLRFHWSNAQKLYSAISLTFAVILALALLFRGVMPSQNRSEMGDCLWRSGLSNVVSAEDVGMHTSQLQAASYEQSGSWFVTKTDYWESWPEGTISSTVYQCRGFQNRVLSEQMERGGWTFVKSGYDQMWQTETGDRYRVLIQQGNQVVSLTSDQPLTELLDGTVQLDIVQH